MAARFFDVSESEIDQYLFSRIIINVIIVKELVASDDVNIGEDYSPIFTSPEATNC